MLAAFQLCIDRGDNFDCTWTQFPVKGWSGRIKDCATEVQNCPTLSEGELPRETIGFRWVQHDALGEAEPNTGEGSELTAVMILSVRNSPSVFKWDFTKVADLLPLNTTHAYDGGAPRNS